MLDALPSEEPPTVAEAMQELQEKLTRPPISKQTKNPAETVHPLEGLDINSPAAAEIMGKLQAEIAQLRAQVSDIQQAPTGGGAVIDSGPSGYPWQYFKRPSDGDQADWIVYAPGGANERGQRDSGAFVQYMTKGMKPITGYGNCAPPSAYHSLGPGAPFVPMLERGGAREFPASQVLTYKWHIAPPLEGVVFPQYEAVKDRVRHFECEDCDRYDMWMLDDDTETGMACFRHLRSNTEDGRHEYSRREATLILREQGVPFNAGRFAAISEELKRMEISGNAGDLQPAAKGEAEEA
jgi:hypothetical protein